MERSEIVSLLRQEAEKGAGICALVDVMRSKVGNDLSSFVAVSLVMDAFQLPLSTVRELPGARCMGGDVYNNAEIEDLLNPAIRTAVSRDS